MPAVPPPTRPRFHDLARTLESEIARGVYPLGTTIPTEMALCQQFGASRHTVRAAIERLVRKGLVTRRPRVGTVVRRLEPLPENYTMAVGSESDLLQYAATTRLIILNRTLRTVPEGEEGLEPHAGEQWLFVEGLRRADGAARPLSFHAVWIHPDFRGVSGIAGEVTESIFHLIAREFGLSIVRIVQEIHAAPLPEHSARALELPAGSGGLWVRRQYFDQTGRMVEQALGMHPAETFRFRLTLNRTPGPA